MARRPNGTSSTYLGKDGWWHGRIIVGVRDNGKADRRHVMAKTEAEIIKKVRRLERQRDSGRVRKAGKPWTVAAWLEHWLDNIAQPSLRDSSYEAYRTAVHTHLIPGIGAHRLDKLEPEHLEKLYARMLTDKNPKTGRTRKPATVHQVHRTVRTALGEAVRRGHLARNVATLAKAPRITPEEIQPYTVDEVKRLLAVAAKRRNGARWAIALALGLRQGEALGLRWDDIDLDAGVLRVRRSRLRPRHQHGCTNGQCGTTPGRCPQRQPARPATADTKSYAGRRTVGLPDELAALLRQHHDHQDAERRAARQLWRDEGWVFATETGAATNPHTDYEEWKRLVKAARVRPGRLHDARHTAATVLLILGIPERAVMGVMGWSTTTMAARYQHITDPIRHDIAQRVGGLIWTSGTSPQSDGGGDEGAAGVRVPA